jgi:hypothetical protein
VVNADVDIQLHGGIGVTEEHHASLLLKPAPRPAVRLGTNAAGEVLHAELDV